MLTSIINRSTEEKHYFPTELSNIITGYVKAMLYWVDEKKLNLLLLSSNPAAIDLLKANQDKIYWVSLSGNPGLFGESPVFVFNYLNELRW